MHRKFDFGKVDWNGTGRKINRVIVEVTLIGEEGKECFSASGDVMNARETDCICSGQCLDEISQYIHTPEFNLIYKWWKNYHLNDMHSGTPEQEAEVKRWLKETNQKYDYRNVCDRLKEVGIYTVDYNGEPYTYGHSWLFEQIPSEEVKEIKKLLENS